MTRQQPVALLAPKALQTACRTIVRVSRLAAICETALRAMLMDAHHTFVQSSPYPSRSTLTSSSSSSLSTSSSASPTASPLSTHSFWLNILHHFEPPEMLQDEFIAVGFSISLNFSQLVLNRTPHYFSFVLPSQSCMSSSRLLSLLLSTLSRYRRSSVYPHSNPPTFASSSSSSFQVAPSAPGVPGVPGGASVSQSTVRMQAECQMMLSLPFQAKLTIAAGDEPLLVCLIRSY
jgi:hypothetical protein